VGPTQFVTQCVTIREGAIESLMYRRFDASKPLPNSAVSHTPIRGRSFVPYFARSAPAFARTRRCAFQLPNKCRPVPRPSPKGALPGFPNQSAKPSPAIRRKPPGP